MSTYSVTFYLMSPKSSNENDPSTVAFPIMCCAFYTYNTVNVKAGYSQVLLGMSALTFPILPPTLRYNRLWKSDLLDLEHSQPLTMGHHYP